MFMSIELMLNAANLALVAFGRRVGNPDGQAVVFFAMAVAAAEVAVGVAVIVPIFPLPRRPSGGDINPMRLEQGGGMAKTIPERERAAGPRAGAPPGRGRPHDTRP